VLPHSGQTEISISKTRLSRSAQVSGGGSTTVTDEDNRMCFSYVMNQMKAAMVGDERSGSLTRAL